MKLLTSLIVALTATLVSCSPLEIEARATHSCVCGSKHPLDPLSLLLIALQTTAKSFTNADIVGAVNKEYTTNPNPITSS